MLVQQPTALAAALPFQFSLKSNYMNKPILGGNIQVCMFQTLLSYFTQDIAMILQSVYMYITVQ